jgi:hypothetical protein
MIFELLRDKGIGADKAVTADRDDLKKVVKYLEDHGTAGLSAEAISYLESELNTAFTDKTYSGRMDKRVTELKKMRALITPPATPPVTPPPVYYGPPAPVLGPDDV